MLLDHTYGPPPRAPRPYAPFSSHLPRPNIPHLQQNQSIQRPPAAFFNGRPTSNALQ
ncbi:hypothetical protein F2Q70_00023788 [Brassica cretica]|nr:hypothetical protein F2Q70_00023788 [Brassica cretica]